MANEIFTFKQRLNFSWLLRMAWRDSRRNWSRLFLFISSIILGIAALVAIFSLGENAKQDIQQQAKTLVGADLVIDGNKAASGPSQQILDSLGANKSEERSFASMIYFIKNQGSRLVQVRALQGDYPFYGSFETEPAAAGIAFRTGRGALVDQTLMMQFDASVGDSINIGSLSFVIEGALVKAPGRNSFSTTIAPPVYIPLQYLAQTGLEKRGSRISYNYYYRMDPAVDMEKLSASIRPRLEKEGFGVETVESRKKNTGRVFDDFNRFLTLLSFIALLLGCIGVASSIHIYIREKIHSIAVLRCMGASGWQAFLIYLVQVMFIGLAGSLVGALSGTLLLQLLPAVLKDFLPFTLSSRISWSSAGQGLLLGMVIALLFALLPLLSIRKVSALTVLRYPVETGRRRPDAWTLTVYCIIFLFITYFARLQMEGWKQGLAFSMSILFGFGILALVAWSLRWAVRRFFPASWNYLWRQGLSNLYRPNNQTLVLLTTIGLGTAFIGTLYFVQTILINRLVLSSYKSQPNMVIFDIQTNQKDAIADLARKNHIGIIQQIPVVSMRIDQINGKAPPSRDEDTARRGPRRGFENDIRASFRDSLVAGEKITSGSWQGRLIHPGDTPRISLEDQWSRRVNLKLGDQVVFNVQGTLVPTVVGSLRQNDSRGTPTNFRVIFPSGVLESAPQFHVLLLRVPSSPQSAQFQKAIVKAFPNVSLIDLGLILKVLEEVLDKVGFVIKFMAGFSILTGFIVLIASVLISKFQRMQEMVLLRTLGASRRQITTIAIIEYFFLGSLAAATGLLLSLAGTWALAVYSFETSFAPSPWPILVIFAVVSGLTILIGLLNSRDVIGKPPLEVLRKEG